MPMSHIISFLARLYPPKIIDRILIEVIQMFLCLPFFFLFSKIQVMVSPDTVTSLCLDLQRMTALPVIQIMNSPEKQSSRFYLKEHLKSLTLTARRWSSTAPLCSLSALGWRGC